MLNYIRAELYKVSRRRQFYGLTGVLLLLELLFAVIWTGGPSSFANMVGLLNTTMMIGLYLTPLLTDLVFSSQHRQTLKNEVSFGLPRSRIYLGKLFSSLIVSLLVCGLVLVCYLGFTWLYCTHAGAAEEQTVLRVLEFVVLGSLPLWMGMLGLSVMAFFLIPNHTVAGTLLVTSLFVADFISVLLTAVQVPGVQALGELMQGILLTSPFGQFQGALTARLMAHNWLLGLGWFLGSTAAGLAIFRRREIP